MLFSNESKILIKNFAATLLVQCVCNESGVCLTVSVRNGCTVAKPCEIGPRLLLITNGISHIAF